MENDGYRYDNRKFLERVKKLTILASKYLHSLNIFNQWNIPSNHRHEMDKGKGSCDNCGRKHYNPDYPHTNDKAKIKKAKEERASCRGGGGCGGRRGGGR